MPHRAKSLPRNWVRREPRWGWSSSRAECFRRLSRVAVRHFDGIVEICEDVANVFNADRQPDQLGSYAGVFLLFDRELGMSGRRGVDDQRFGIANVSQQGKQLERIDQLLARLEASLDAEGDQRALAVGQIFLGPSVVLAGGEPGIV